MVASNDSSEQDGLPDRWPLQPRPANLSAILAADVAGYSRLMEADEEGTHERLKTHPRRTD